MKKGLLLMALLLTGLVGAAAHTTSGSAKTDFVTQAVDVVAPSANASIPTGSTFNVVANLSNTSDNNYDMFWYVDNGTWNWMGNNNDSQGDKQASINVTDWSWHTPSNKYVIDVVAVMHGTGQRIYSNTTIYIGSPSATSTATTTPVSSTKPVASSTSAPATTTPVALPTNLYINPNNEAAQTAASSSDATTKRIMSKLAATPTATWFGDWNQNIQSDVAAVTTAAGNAGKTPVLVAYNIPDRDCNGYSSGGAPSAAAYQSWISSFAAGIGSHSAIVILEPDATAQESCLSSGDQSTRNQLLQYAISTLKANPGTHVYLDAGNPSWVAAGDMATRLNNAGISKADGFSLNVSNFFTTSQNVTYGQQVSALVGNKHFVIDTSRNGNGSDGTWCNPSGRALGSTPTSNTSNPLVDYLLWVKTPGESDGSCNGGPAAGVWWPSYAVTLGENAGW
jgi:endoglucanase